MIIHLNSNDYDKKELLSNNETAHCTIILDSESNKLLNQASKNANRPKKVEATLRLADHLKRFKSDFNYICASSAVTSSEVEND